MRAVSSVCKQNPSRVRRDWQAGGRHVSAHIINIHDLSASACPYAMTQRDNCGSRLLQPLVSVTKIGTQVSCHSKSLFFRSLSIKQSGPHAKMPRGEERGPNQGSGMCFWNGNRSGRAPGRIKKTCIHGGWVGGEKICRRFGGRGGLRKSKGRER